MYKFRIVLASIALLAAQQVFADSAMSSDSRPCLKVAKACAAAGYARRNQGNRRFWMGCMKPLLMNHKVSGVTVDPAMVKQCRNDKIKAMKQEVQDLQRALSQGSY